MAYSSSTNNNRRRKIPSDLLQRRLAQGFLLVVSLLHLYLCPHSKVEESFNLQATHDLVYHGITPAVMMSTSPLWYNASTAKAPLPALPYDHVSYPGVVPRTFLGPFVLSWAIQLLRIPGLWCSIELLDYPLLVQALARAILLLATVQAWCQVARALDRNKRVTSAKYASIPYSASGTYLLLVTACQFHMPFYASRMLPNAFALLVVLHALKAWLLEDAKTTASLLVFATAIFRCDLLLLLFTVGLSLLITKRLSVFQAIRIGIVTGILSLVLTVPLDSLMWQRWVWPEGEVFYYNAIMGKSSDWGTWPWHWYATKAIPKLLLMCIVWVPCAFLSLPETIVAWWESRQQPATVATRLWDTSWWEYLLPAVGYVALYSCLGHKEVRFLFPVMPLLNLAVAVGMARVHKLVFPPSNKEKRVSGLAKLGYLACIASLLLTFLASSAFLAVSQQNYPGGEALLRLERHLHDYQHERGLVSNDSEVRVYIDVAAAMSGISLFGQRHATGLGLNATTAALNAASPQTLEWKFTKAGYEDEHAMKEDIFEYSASFTHIIAEAGDSSASRGGASSPKISTNSFTLVDVVPGRPRLDFKGGRIATQDYLYIWERIGYWKDIRG